MGRGRIWTDREKQWLKHVYGRKPIEEIAKALRRKPNAVYQQACKLGIQKNKFEEPDWNAMRRILNELAST